MKDSVGHIHVPKRRSAVHEEAVGPGRSRQRTKPVIANGKIGGKLMQNGKRARCIKLHCFRPCVGLTLRVVPCKITHKSEIWTLDLFKNIGKVVMGVNLVRSRIGRIAQHHSHCCWSLRYGIAARVGIRSRIREIYSIDARQTAKHAIKGIVFQHENHHVLNIHLLNSYLQWRD